VSVGRPSAKRTQRGQGFLGRSDPLAKILDLADDAIISVDQKQSIILFNQAAEHMFGYSAREARGEPLDNLLPVSALGLGERRQIVGRRKDGNEFPAEASLSIAKFNGETVLTVIMRDITQRTLVEERLRASLREKDVLLEEVHQLVKNNLQVISSLLGLQARSIRDAAVRKMFEESRDRIQSMAFLHELLYQSDSLEKIDFADYIRRLAAHLFRSHGIGDRISLYLNLDRVYFDKDAVVPCGLILNELLSNTFKHAFPGEQTGEVRIELTGEAGTELGYASGTTGRVIGQPVWAAGAVVRLLVADNGIGLPEGFDWAASQSLGLRLVRTLARQLEAVVEMKSAAGTVFAITFPAAEVAT